MPRWPMLICGLFLIGLGVFSLNQREIAILGLVFGGLALVRAIVAFARRQPNA